MGLCPGRMRTMKYIFNKDYEREQQIEISKTLHDNVIIRIARAPYNEHDVDIEVSTEDCQGFAEQILEFLKSDTTLDNPSDV